VDLADLVVEVDNQQIDLAGVADMEAQRLEVPPESDTLSIASRQVRRAKQSSTGGTSPQSWKRGTAERVAGHE
jgi:hypothetical protein